MLFLPPLGGWISRGANLTLAKDVHLANRSDVSQEIRTFSFKLEIVWVGSF